MNEQPEGFNPIALSSSQETPRFIEPTNPNLEPGHPDYLYHLGLGTQDDLEGKFGDVKFVCMGGSADRMHKFAIALSKQFNLPDEPKPIGKTERYSLFKVGVVICVNHGMGFGSVSICLHEIAKLLWHAKARDVCFLRLGTSGGIGCKPGTVIISTEALNGGLQPYYSLFVAGKEVHRPTTLDRGLAEEILSCKGDLDAELGRTVACDDFYEGQGRTDGFFADHTEKDKMDFLRQCQAEGVKNIEMEAVPFAAFCQKAGIRGADVCCTLLDRLDGDQVTATSEQLAQYSQNTLDLATRFILQKLGATGATNARIQRQALFRAESVIGQGWGMEIKK